MSLQDCISQKPEARSLQGNKLAGSPEGMKAQGTGSFKNALPFEGFLKFMPVPFERLAPLLKGN